ncbi:MAG TPA: hypothetical protein VKT28_17815 [Puia sp.]|nr:hypothetical protein [Puia sp.]
MQKKNFLLGIFAGIFSAVACLVYIRVYFFAFEISFKKLINIGSVSGLCILACMLAAVGYSLFQKWFGKKSEMIFNLTFTLLTFVSIIIPISITLPLDLQNPEMFPGLAIPMHFFPAIGWYTLKPFFIKE